MELWHIESSVVREHELEVESFSGSQLIVLCLCIKISAHKPSKYMEEKIKFKPDI